MIKVHAIYENGVFRPTQRVDLPERAEVEFEPRLIRNGEDQSRADERIWEILSMRCDSGETDVAERHNEHQP